MASSDSLFGALLQSATRLFAQLSISGGDAAESSGGGAGSASEAAAAPQHADAAAATPFAAPRLPEDLTCVVFDPRMLFHVSPRHHTEQASRIASIFGKLTAAGVLRHPGVTLRRAAFVPRSSLLAVHSQAHVSYIEGLDSRPASEVAGTEAEESVPEDPVDATGVPLASRFAHVNTAHAERLLAGELADFARSVKLRTDITRFGDTYASDFSPAVAYLAAGGVLAAVDAVAGGNARNAFAIVRPPGHHCHEAQAGGFCLFNNAAVAARHAQRVHGVGKVAILDWDVHHGDGTQSIFADDPSVLFISLHRFDGGSFYPNDPVHAAASYVGVGAGAGYSVNIPWDGAGMGDEEYAAAFARVVLPILSEYAPEMILVSSGFDAAAGDVLGGCEVTPLQYGVMTALVTALAPPRGVVLMLEGGYNLTSIAMDAEAVTRALIDARAIAAAGDAAASRGGAALLTPERIPPAVTTHPLAVAALTKVITAQAPYWRCMKQALDDALSCAAASPPPPPVPAGSSEEERLPCLWGTAAPPSPAAVPLKDAASTWTDLPTTLTIDNLVITRTFEAEVSVSLTATDVGSSSSSSSAYAGVPAVYDALLVETEEGGGTGRTLRSAAFKAAKASVGADSPRKNAEPTESAEPGPLRAGGLGPDSLLGAYSLAQLQTREKRMGRGLLYIEAETLVDPTAAAAEAAAAAAAAAAPAPAPEEEATAAAPVAASGKSAAAASRLARMKAAAAAKKAAGGGGSGASDGPAVPKGLTRWFLGLSDESGRTLFRVRVATGAGVAPPPAPLPSVATIPLHLGASSSPAAAQLFEATHRDVSGKTRMLVLPCLGAPNSTGSGQWYARFEDRVLRPLVTACRGSSSSEGVSTFPLPPIFAPEDRMPLGYTLFFPRAADAVKFTKMAAALPSKAVQGAAVTPSPVAAAPAPAPVPAPAPAPVPAAAAVPPAPIVSTALEGDDDDEIGGPTRAPAPVPVPSPAPAPVSTQLEGDDDDELGGPAPAPAARPAPAAVTAAPPTATVASTQLEGDDDDELGGPAPAPAPRAPAPAPAASAPAAGYTTRSGRVSAPPVRYADEFASSGGSRSNATTSASADRKASAGSEGDGEGGTAEDAATAAAVEAADAAAAGAAVWTLLPERLSPFPATVSNVAHLVAYRVKGAQVADEAHAASPVPLPALQDWLAANSPDAPEPRTFMLPANMPTWRLDATRGVGTLTTRASSALPWLLLTTKNECLPRQIASITKVATFIVVLGLNDALLAANGGADSAATAEKHVSRHPLKEGYWGLHSTLVPVSAVAANVNRGTKAELEAGTYYTLWDLLCGMMLPSGNDAATALAEYYGQVCGAAGREALLEVAAAPGLPLSCSESEAALLATPAGAAAVNTAPFEPAPHYDASPYQLAPTSPLPAFVAEMNRMCVAIGALDTAFGNPHGMIHDRHNSSAADVARLVSVAMSDARFRSVVSLTKHAFEAVPAPAGEAPHVYSPGAGGEGTSNGTRPAVPSTTAAAASGVPKPRRLRWVNTNQLLGSRTAVRGLDIDGVKTGFTRGAAACLSVHAVSEDPIPAAHRPSPASSSPSPPLDEYLSITLGSRNTTMRFVDNQRVLKYSADAVAALRKEVA